MQEVAQDAQVIGFDLGWLSAWSTALRAAGERVTLRPKLQRLSTQLEFARQHLADLEARFAQVSEYDASLATAALNLEDPDREELVFADWLD
ncbi:hypothetical protein RHMOL_Rhmol05G0180700 [Rhododendron molle]|uniref:Uncharacterized protein n=1 Tax=Rhododendron molle TaxID=49168 RepID=A0ACC0NQ99_RHOML|nr:hypothetical protein RHMOL_Rhmol05G0180700 [Rhododendron molle]